MGVLDKITGFLSGGLGEKIAGIIDQRVPDRDLAAKLKHDFETMLAQQAHELARLEHETQQEIIRGQNETNKLEATQDLFRGGWRPMVGWFCAFGLGYQMLLRPMLEWVGSMQGWMPPPPLELDTLLTLLFGMLGLGAYRTYEKTSKNP